MQTLTSIQCRYEATGLLWNLADNADLAAPLTDATLDLLVTVAQDEANFRARVKAAKALERLSEAASSARRERIAKAAVEVLCGLLQDRARVLPHEADCRVHAASALTHLAVNDCFRKRIYVAMFGNAP